MSARRRDLQRFAAGNRCAVGILMGAVFQIGASEPILIYGGGIFGIGCANRIIAAGYDVVGIVDINPGGVKNAPVPAFTPDEAALKFNNAFVWVCLANGLTHTGIARELSHSGFERVLFLPLYLTGNAAKQMISAFNAFFIGNYSVLIPYYYNIWNVQAEDYILDENSGFVTVMIHKNHLFTNEAVFEQPSDNPYSLHKMLNNPTRPYLPFVPLYRLNDLYKDRFRQARAELFHFFENVIHTDFYYFINCPCACTLSDDGTKWYILDGNHRASFLLIKGFDTIPARVRLNEYIRYFREEAAQEVMNYCKKRGSLPHPIEHPAFLRFPVDESNKDEIFDKLLQSLSGTEE